MDFWVDSPLNKAHFYDRKATSYARRFLFDEAIECHIAACQELKKIHSLTENFKALQSIDLQYDYHSKQKDFLRLKKVQYHTYKEALRVQKEAISRIMKARGALEKESEDDKQGATLKKAIFKTIEEADSLLELLIQRDDEEIMNRDNQTCVGDKENLKITSGSKRPKDDNTVIEELKIVNYQLRSLISELMSQLMSSEKEVQTLRQRVAELETENRQLKPGSASPSAYSSPFVLSPSEEVLHRGAGSELPCLAPLELPNFDLAALRSKKRDPSDS